MYNHKELRNTKIDRLRYADTISDIYVCHLARITLCELECSCTVDVSFPQLVTEHIVSIVPTHKSQRYGEKM